MGNLRQKYDDSEWKELENRVVIENDFKIFDNFVIHVNRSQSENRPYLITWEDDLGNHGSEVISTKEFNKKYN